MSKTIQKNISKNDAFNAVLNALYNNKDIKETIRTSGLSAHEINTKLVKEKQFSCFEIILTWDDAKLAAMERDLIKFLSDYGFTLERGTSRTDTISLYDRALRSGPIGIADAFLQIGATPLSVEKKGTIKENFGVDLVTWTHPHHFKTMMCGVEAMGRVLDKELSTGVNINDAGDSSRNPLSHVFFNLASYIKNDDPEECIKYIELFTSRGADYRITGFDDPGSCLSNFMNESVSESMFAIGSRILDALDERLNIVPLPGDESNQFIAYHLNKKLSAEASSRITRSSSTLPKSRRF